MVVSPATNVVAMGSVPTHVHAPKDPRTRDMRMYRHTAHRYHANIIYILARPLIDPHARLYICVRVVVGGQWPRAGQMCQTPPHMCARSNAAFPFTAQPEGRFHGALNLH